MSQGTQTLHVGDGSELQELKAALITANNRESDLRGRLAITCRSAAQSQIEASHFETRSLSLETWPSQPL